MLFDDFKGLKFWKFNEEIVKKRHEKRKVKGRYACMHRREKYVMDFYMTWSHFMNIFWKLYAREWFLWSSKDCRNPPKSNKSRENKHSSTNW